MLKRHVSIYLYRKLRFACWSCQHATVGVLHLHCKGEMSGLLWSRCDRSLAVKRVSLSAKYQTRPTVFVALQQACHYIYIYVFTYAPYYMNITCKHMCNSAVFSAYVFSSGQPLREAKTFSDICEDLPLRRSSAAQLTGHS